ncbi:MAG: hypothetical protein H7833_16230 [Magnetococcus sp. DMHC-1]|nr:hypothetical protein [Magnetococcales bacterium]
MKRQFGNFIKGMGSVFNVYPGMADMPKELQRYMNPPRTVEEGLLADTNALNQDWQKVGSAMHQAVSGIERA